MGRIPKIPEGCKGVMKLDGKWIGVKEFRLIPKRGCKCRDCQKERERRKNEQVHRTSKGRNKRSI